ncbi:MAG: AAA-like domain-containing protein [Cyanobacteria bacterium J06600_6]
MKYKFSGTLPQNDPSYIEREADRELYQKLKNRQFCYVFNSRKLGKSSLRVRVMSRLQQEGFTCAAIDLSLDEVELASAEQWYFGICYSIAQDLKIAIDLDKWWDCYPRLSSLSKLKYFIKILLTKIPGNIVIFIDEIDSVLSLNFPTDDFFAFIRGCYNARADSREYQRFGICLLGVAAPSALIKDKQRTPFNIGHSIELTGFTLTEAQPLISGLADKVSYPQQTLQEILFWTGGQPFLTQKLCYLIAKDDSQKIAVKQLVQTQIIDNWEDRDEPEHLRTIRDRLLYDQQQVVKLLEIYRCILTGKAIARNSQDEILLLKLAGLVVWRKDCLEVYNPIYQAVFNLAWIEKELAILRPYAEKINAWLDSEFNSAHLLDKQELYHAQQWAADKSLSIYDYQFLNASLDRLLKKAEAEADKILTTAKKRARKQQLIAILFSVGAALVGGWASLESFDLRKQQHLELQKRISTGEKILLRSDFNKEWGADEYKLGNYQTAVEGFKRSLESSPQDPESVIYQSNALFANANPISIAVSVPIGKNEQVAAQILRGVALAQQEVNQPCLLSASPLDKSPPKNCGIRGRSLQVKIVNDDNEPEIASQLAKELVKDKSILGVVGHNASDVSVEAAKVYRGNLVMISPTSFIADLPKERESVRDRDNYIFRTVPSLTTVIGSLAERITQELGERPKLVICYDSAAINSKSHIAALEKFQAQIDLIKTPECDFNQSSANSEYDRILRQSIKQGANSLLLVPHIDRIHEAIELASVNYRQKPSQRLRLFSGPSLYTAKTLANFTRQSNQDALTRKQIGKHKAIVGMQLIVPWYPVQAKGDRFVRQAESLWGDLYRSDRVTWRTATAYDATIALVKALEPEIEPTRRTVRDNLSAPGFSFQGATGRVQFAEGERISEREYFLEIQENTESLTVVDFVLIDP